MLSVLYALIVDTVKKIIPHITIRLLYALKQEIFPLKTAAWYCPVYQEKGLRGILLEAWKP